MREGSFCFDFDRIVPNKKQQKKGHSRYRIILKKEKKSFQRHTWGRFSWDSIVDYDAKLIGDSIAEYAFMVNRTRKKLAILN